MFATMSYGVYYFFASLMLLSAVFVFFLVPETKGIPLEAMDRLFSNDYPARKAHKIVMAQVRAEDQAFRRENVDEGAKAEEAGYTVAGKHVESV